MSKTLSTLSFLLFTTLYTLSVQAQDSTKRHLPIIDVHVHAMKVNPAFAGDMCPWFLSEHARCRSQ